MIRSIFTILLAFGLFSACNDETQRLSNYEVHGIDVSHYQGQIDWSVVANQEIEFAFVKATEGETLKDSIFQYNWEACRKNGIVRGAYHFFIPSISAHNQSNHFINTVDLQDGDLPPVLDIETDNNLSKEAIVNRAMSWLITVEYHYNIRPIIYTNQKFYLKYLADSFQDYPIWIARYGGQKPALNKDWIFWQYGNRGRLAGIEGFVDFNVFISNKKELLQLCKGKATSLSIVE